MNRRLLLALAGVGTAAGAVFLMSGTAHALAPPPAASKPPTPTTHLTIPKPPVVAPVTTVTTKVTNEVKHAAPVKHVAATVPVVVKRLTGTLDHSPAEPDSLAQRALAVAAHPARVARSPHASAVRATVSTRTVSPRAGTQTRRTPNRPASHHSKPAFAVAGLSANALAPAHSSVDSPCASLTTRTPFVSTATQWLTFPTADRTRPGFLVGSARPG